MVADGLIENGQPRRYDVLRRIDDGLRQRARDALLAYLCAMNRVALPDGSTATSPNQLSDVLLLDVDAGSCQRAARIDEAITAVQTFVQRARLGLEPFFTPGPSSCCSGTADTPRCAPGSSAPAAATTARTGSPSTSSTTPDAARRSASWRPICTAPT